MKRFLGLRLDAVTRESLYEFVEASIRERRKSLITHLNVHAVNLAHRDRDFRRAISKSDLVYCDGVGVLLAAKLLGVRVPERMTAPDWMDEFARFLRDRGRSLYFLGNAPETLELGLRLLRERTPGLQVDGHHGFFENDDEAIRGIRGDVLMVGMGMPRQELWVERNLARLSVHAVITVGAVLEWYTGQWKRGPRWMTDRGGEWVGRLLTQPGHVWRRYLIGNPLFVGRAILSLIL